MAIVGYMGSGKSTVGRLLARSLGWEFVDLDREICSRAGRSIPEIFAESGEVYFRDLERDALLAALDGCAGRVIACGGGIIVRPENRRALKRAATVFLREDAGVLYARTRNAERPLRGASMQHFEERYSERLPFYEQVADLDVDVGGRPAKVVAEEIERWLDA